MKMEEELEEYICRHSDPEPEALWRAWRRSNLQLVGGRMCSGHLQGRFLRMLVRLTGARHILEIGCYSGYATVSLAEGLAEGGSVVTIEHDDELETHIRRTLRDCGVEDRVHLLIGDALTLMAQMESASIDFIFMDADKRQYPEYYVEARRLVRPGGLIVADNTLWDGHVIEAGHSHDPQTAAILRFNDMVARDPGVEKVILPLRDGLSLIRVCENRKTGAKS